MVFNEYQLGGGYETRDSLILPSSEHSIPMNHVTGVPDPVERRAPLPTAEQRNTQNPMQVVESIGATAMPVDAQVSYRQL